MSIQNSLIKLAQFMEGKSLEDQEKIMEGIGTFKSIPHVAKQAIVEIIVDSVLNESDILDLSPSAKSCRLN